jgi:hypothetical protein
VVVEIVGDAAGELAHRSIFALKHASSAHLAGDVAEQVTGRGPPGPPPEDADVPAAAPAGAEKGRRRPVEPRPQPAEERRPASSRGSSATGSG